MIEAKSKPLMAVVREVMDEAEGNFADALVLLMARGQEDPELYRQIMTPELYERRCRWALLQAGVHDRRALWAERKPVSSPSSNAAPDFETYRDGIALAFRIPRPGGRGDMALANATLVDLQNAEKFYAAKAYAYRRALLFMRKIQGHLGKGQQVRDVLTDAALSELMDEVEKEAAL